MSDGRQETEGGATRPVVRVPAAKTGRVNEREWRGAAAAAQRRAKRREEVEARVAAANRERVKWALLIIGLLVGMAMLADCRGMASRLRAAAENGGGLAREGDAASILAGLEAGDGKRYVDKGGKFSFAWPKGWRELKKDPESIFDASLRGPYDMEMHVECWVTNGMDYGKLVQRLREIDRNMAATSHIDAAKVGRVKAVKRSVQLYQNKILMLDFLTGNLEHHVQFVIPTAMYDEYEPVFLRLMQTYEAGQAIRVE